MAAATSDIVIYFAPHFQTFTDSVVSPRFRTLLEACDVCVLEWADRWTAYEPDLESLFNQLSRGEIRWATSRRQGNLSPFDGELQNSIRGRNKEIVLERSPVEYPIIQEEEKVNALAGSNRLDEATSLYRNQLRILIWNLIDRDRALVELLRKLRLGRKLFVFRGADHERYLRNALDRGSIAYSCYTYEEPPLLRRLMSSLSMGEQISDIDLQRVIYAMSRRQRDDYPEFVRLQKEAEAMSESEILSRFSAGTP